jgi:hypothetical protein
MKKLPRRRKTAYVVINESNGTMYNDDVTVYFLLLKNCMLSAVWCWIFSTHLPKVVFSFMFLDIFSSLAGVTASRPELVFGALFGAGVFVTTVVAGTVAITQPFKVRKLQYSTSNSTVQVQDT